VRFETGEWKSQWPLRPRVRSFLCIQERNYILKVCNLSWLCKPVKYWYEKPRSLDQAFLKALIAGILGNWFSCLTGYQNVTDGRTDGQNCYNSIVKCITVQCLCARNSPRREGEIWEFGDLRKLGSVSNYIQQWSPDPHISQKLCPYYSRIFLSFS